MKKIVLVCISLGLALLVLAWAYYFTGLPAQLGLIEVPRIKLEQELQKGAATTELTLSSASRLEEFGGGVSHLTIMGARDKALGSYADCYDEEGKPREHISAATSLVKYWRSEGGRHYYRALYFHQGGGTGLHLRLYFITGFGYVYGSDLER